MKEVSQKQALYDLVDLYYTQKPKLVVDQICFHVAYEALKICREENAELMSKITDLENQLAALRKPNETWVEALRGGG